LKAIKVTLSIALLATALALPAVAEQDSLATTSLRRFVAFNVSCDQQVTPRQIAKLLEPLNPELVST
tara:strand:+ start:9726 stop:9926 length:201 start_codon:yes stop_codon:yes gene_type:complete